MTPKGRVEDDGAVREWRRIMGQRIAAARKKRGWKGFELAELVGVQPGTLSGWENGTHGMTVENLRVLVEVTGESSSYFLPEKLGKRDSVEALSRGLGVLLGAARLRKLLEIPEARLRREIDAVIGIWATERNDHPPARPRTPGKLRQPSSE